jgi:hypothetical protein
MLPSALPSSPNTVMPSEFSATASPNWSSNTSASITMFFHMSKSLARSCGGDGGRLELADWDHVEDLGPEAIGKRLARLGVCQLAGQELADLDSRLNTVILVFGMTPGARLPD